MLCCQRGKAGAGRLRLPLGFFSPRFARYYRDSAGAEFRTLIKAYGIRFDVIVNGKVCGWSSHSVVGQGGVWEVGDPLGI